MQLKPLASLVIMLSMVIGTEGQIVPGLKQSRISCGAERTGMYLSLINGLRIGLVANPTSRIGTVHLLDTLIRSGVNVKKVFAPEHGFRGEGEAGAKITDGVDSATGIRVVSLYGKHKEPTSEDLADIDMVVFDIQDVGARFYTYISTLHLVMEACAKSAKPLLVLDRPNPNGFYIDGPVLDTTFRSFVGMHPVPVVHGLTIGEYAGMINGERWLKNGVQCDLTVIPCIGYDHQTEYILPVKPSPNLPNQTAVYLYPTLCFFEGSVISIGRGTDFPFQVYGHPSMPGDFSFTPRSLPGMSLQPMYENKTCHGRDLRGGGMDEFMKKPGIVLEWLEDAYSRINLGSGFFTGYFDTLAGSSQLRIQIQQGVSPDKIRARWEPGLRKYQEMRSKYLLYQDSEFCQRHQAPGTGLR
jgi:uncharacterized protein YbbC (DUF1343 family)